MDNPDTHATSDTRHLIKHKQNRKHNTESFKMSNTDLNNKKTIEQHEWE